MNICRAPHLEMSSKRVWLNWFNAELPPKRYWQGGGGGWRKREIILITTLSPSEWMCAGLA